MIELSAASVKSGQPPHLAIKDSFLEPIYFQVIDDLLISHSTYRCLHSSVCITRFSPSLLIVDVLPDLMKMKRLHSLMQVIECDMSNYFVV